MFKHSDKILVILSLLAWLSTGFASHAGTGQTVDAVYTALWWSPEQMVGLDPNNPPEKTTSVVMKKWEYSDPVGIPHPDTLTLVVEFRPKAVADGKISLRTWWRVGRKWVAGPQADVRDKQVHVGASSVSFTIPVAEGINRLSPSLLRSEVLLNGGAVAHADLPIQLGD